MIGNHFSSSRGSSSGISNRNLLVKKGRILGMNRTVVSITATAAALLMQCNSQKKHVISLGVIPKGRGGEGRGGERGAHWDPP